MEFDIEVIWITSFYSLIQARGVALAIVCESSVCQSKKKKRKTFMAFCLLYQIYYHIFSY